jgi:hypothetical protein
LRCINDDLCAPSACGFRNEWLMRWVGFPIRKAARMHACETFEMALLNAWTVCRFCHGCLMQRDGFPGRVNNLD